MTAGSTGSLNGSSTNGFLWTTGTNDLDLIFNTTGIYTVKLYVFNDKCGLDSTVKVICVRTPPSAQFTMNRNSSCGPGTAQFTNTSPASGCQGDRYNWKVTYSDPIGMRFHTNTCLAVHQWF